MILGKNKLMDLVLLAPPPPKKKYNSLTLLSLCACHRDFLFYKEF